MSDSEEENTQSMYNVELIDWVKINQFIVMLVIQGHIIN